MESEECGEDQRLEQYRVWGRPIRQEYALHWPVNEQGLHTARRCGKGAYPCGFRCHDLSSEREREARVRARSRRHSVVHSEGDMFYIEPGLPHEVFNVSETEWVHAIVSRSDASEWQNIVPYDRDSE